MPPPVVKYHIGQRLSYDWDGALCTVRYIGKVAGRDGTWLGVEWDSPGRGKHDGSHQGVQYFKCVSKASTAASFVRPTRTFNEPQSFVAALHEKYASEMTREQMPITSKALVEISGKVVEEVGFDKIRRQLAQVQDLKIVITDGLRVAFPTAEGEKSIRETCPKIVELDLSRNLLETFAKVVQICRELDVLRSLRVNGNRFRDVFEDPVLKNSEEAFRGVKELGLEETLLTWEETCEIATKFSTLSTLGAAMNQLSIVPVASFSTLVNTLTTLNLEYNEFTAISDLAGIAGLTSLRNLHLKGNNISNIKSSISTPTPVFPPSLQYLDMSYNAVETWSFVDELPASFPGLIGLRFAHNPIYDSPDLEIVGQTKGTDESYMVTIGRIAGLKSLNFTSISAHDRMNAEVFYLSRIAKQLALVAEAQEASVIAKHQRYAELCALYGEPDIIRTQEINPAFLEARLVTVAFVFATPSQEQAGEQKSKKTTKIPKSYDIYAVKGIAGKLFGYPPLQLRLVWETGEWDPVAGFDDEAGNSSEEEEAEVEREREGGETEGVQGENKGGKWVKREVELRDGPRQLGFCVDGLEAKIRVEVR